MPAVEQRSRETQTPDVVTRDVCRLLVFGTEKLFGLPKFFHSFLYNSSVIRVIYFTKPHPNVCWYHKSQHENAAPTLSPSHIKFTSVIYLFFSFVFILTITSSIYGALERLNLLMACLKETYKSQNSNRHQDPPFRRRQMCLRGARVLFF